MTTKSNSHHHGKLRHRMARGFHSLQSRFCATLRIAVIPATVHNSILNGRPFHRLSRAGIFPYLHRFGIHPPDSPAARCVIRKGDGKDDVAVEVLSYRANHDYLQEYETEELRELLLNYLVRNRSRYLSRTPGDDRAFSDECEDGEVSRGTYRFVLPRLCAICYRLGHAASSCIATGVSLTGMGLGDEDAERLAEALLRNAHPVSELNLQGNRIGDRGAAAIARLVREMDAIVRGNNDRDDAMSINTAVSLLGSWTLDLSDNRISDAGIAAIGSALPHSRTLTMLRVCRNRFGDLALREFAASTLSHNSSLTLLAYTSEHGSPTDPTLGAIRDALRGNVVLRQLLYTTPGRHADDKHSAEIAELLRQNRIFNHRPIRSAAAVLARARVLLHSHSMSRARLPFEVWREVVVAYARGMNLTPMRTTRIVKYAANRGSLVGGGDFRNFLKDVFG